MPTFQGGGVELTVSRAGRRGTLPRRPRAPAPQPTDDYRLRVQEAGHAAVIEGGHHLVAAQAPPTLLGDDPLAFELDQPTGPSVMPRPPLAATPWAARTRRRWYARGGSLPAFGAEPAKR